MKKYLQKLDTLGLLLLVVAVMWYWVSNTWEKWNLAILIAGGVLVIIGIVANYRQILTSVGKRSTKYAGNYVLSLVLVIAIITGLNYIGQRHVKRWDTTGSGQFSLATQTTQVLGKLKKDLHIRAFVKRGDNAPLKELLTEYRTASSLVRYELIDPDRQPDLANRYDVKMYGTVVVSQGDRSEKIESRSEEIQEQDLTNAIIKVGRSEVKKVYFIEGHDEKDPSSEEKTGYASAKKALEEQGYKVGTVNLASEGKVPSDTKVLIEAGPAKRTAPAGTPIHKRFPQQRKGRSFSNGRSYPFCIPSELFQGMGCPGR
jgi:ABC-type uncharacterized transport system involved in gliding motility auxiliary subunit